MRRCSPATWTLGVALSPGDKVADRALAGQRLKGKFSGWSAAETYDVRGVVSASSASVRSFLPDSVELFEADLCGGATPAALEAALAGGVLRDLHRHDGVPDAGVVEKAGDEGVFTRVLKALFAQDLADQGEELNAFELTKRRWQAMIATMDGEGYNTPKNVGRPPTSRSSRRGGRRRATRGSISCCSAASSRSRHVEQMPSRSSTRAAVLDAKATAEAAIQADAKAAGYSWTIVRPGQLNGGPYDNNYYLGTLFQLDKDADTREVTLGRGDELIGDTLVRSTLARARRRRSRLSPRSIWTRPASTSRATSRASRWCGSVGGA